MAKFCYLQAAVAGFDSLFRREVRICRYLILKGMLFDLLSVDLGGLRPGRVLPDRIFDWFSRRHEDTSVRICRDGLRIRRR